MSRSYKGVRLKKHRVYSVDQLAATYSVAKNTVSNWVGEGLKPSNEQRPYLFQGAVVKEFHRQRRARLRRNFLRGQFYCRGCQTGVSPAIETVDDFYAENGKFMYSAQCPNCSRRITKIPDEHDRDLIEDCRNPNTPTQCLHEENTSGCGGIGTKRVMDAPIYHTANDRIIHRWQTYAGRYCEKTVVRHLAAIRYFESFSKGKVFSKLTTDDFAAVREDMKRRANVDQKDSMSASSLKHTVSHLSAFFDWLLKQDGYRRLPKDFAGYLALPKAVVARSCQARQKEFPSLAEAKGLLVSMPAKSLVDQRARALFALAFLGALRADTLVSLRIKHINVERRLILQDASVVRAKAGKNLTVCWFQIPVAFEDAVCEWIETLEGFGFAGDDALFPDARYLKHRVVIPGRNAVAVPVMTTTHAVSRAFSVACKESTIKYTPHAAKHTIGAERDRRSLTKEERKAWSLNMGHDSEVTTDRHYGTMPDDRRFEVFENIGSKKTFDIRELTAEQKAQAFDSLFEIRDG